MGTQGSQGDLFAGQWTQARLIDEWNGYRVARRAGVGRQDGSCGAWALSLWWLSGVVWNESPSLVQQMQFKGVFYCRVSLFDD